jgi:PAS domain S-box-containing protein
LKSRLKKISNILINYSTGNFDSKIPVSGKLDEIDAVIAGINMLGEELKTTTISRNFFNDIFNTVSDMIFVVDQTGSISYANRAAVEKLSPVTKKLTGLKIDRFLKPESPKVSKLINEQITKNKSEYETELLFQSRDRKTTIPVKCFITRLNNQPRKDFECLVTAHDLTKIKAFEVSLKRSEEKYRRIFEESNDFIFISDIEGFIIDMNYAGYKLLKTGATDNGEINIFKLMTGLKEQKLLKTQLTKKGGVENLHVRINCLDGSIADCFISASTIFNDDQSPAGYRGMIKNVTREKETEKLIIRTIVDTQEKERIRFAKDIHDSLGQQLSAIKFYIGTSLSAVTDEKQRQILIKSNEALVQVLADMRSICFNLMPKTLENFGLEQSIKELCNYPGLKENVIFRVQADRDFPELNKNMEIAIFRIVQEFINNSVKHGKAGKIDIGLLVNKNNSITIHLQDNGTGFDTQKAKKARGIGLKNMLSRISSYDGEMQISSSPGKGTKCLILFPVNNKSKNYGSYREKETNHQDPHY